MMATEIESEHGIIYTASTFEYITAIETAIDDVIMVTIDGVSDFNRVIAWETYTVDRRVRLFFENLTSMTFDYDARILAAR